MCVGLFLFLLFFVVVYLSLCMNKGTKGTNMDNNLDLRGELLTF